MANKEFDENAVEDAASETPKPKKIVENEVKVDEPKQESPAPTKPNELSPEQRDALKAQTRRDQIQAELAEEDLKEKRRTKSAKEKKFAGHAGTVVGKGGSNLLIIIAFVIYIVDAWIGYIGFTELGASWGSILQTVIGIVTSSVFLGLIAFHIIALKESIKESIGEIITYAIAIVVLIFTGFSGGLTGWALVHLIFIVVFWYFVIGPNEEDRLRRNIWLIILVLIDFYTYPLLKMFLSIGQVAPIVALPSMFFFVTVYCWKKTENKLAHVLSVIVVSLFVLINYNYISEQIKIAATTAPIEGIERISPWEILKKAGTGFNDFMKDMRKAYDTQMEYATGGYYPSKVEENKDPNSKLGVYLEDVQGADKEFYENEEALVWGSLKARTLDEPIRVYMSCEAGDEKGVIKPDALDNKDKKYEIDKFEEIGFECRFKGGQLKPGANIVKVNVEFNFQTLAFLKTYFMSIERIRALRKDNIDPLDQYGIKEKKGYGVSTYGPVKLGMGTVEPPIGLGQDTESYTYLGITVENQWPHGRIKNITGVGIQVPVNLDLERSMEDKDNFYCREDFEEVGKDGNEGYILYGMTKDEIKNIKTPITAFKSWRCSIKINKDNVKKILGNTPVATYYYRANASYIYEIEQSISVYVKSVPGEKTRLKSCTTKCEDSDGCICDIEGCNIPKGGGIGEKYSCNDYPGSENKLRDFEDSLKYIEKARDYITTSIQINELCLGQNVDGANKTIDSLDISEDDKKAFKNLVEGCSARSARFFELSEERIVNKVKDTVNMFKHIKNDLIGDLKDGNNKQKVNTEKSSFIGKLDEVMNSFNKIYKEGIVVEKRLEYDNTIQNAKDELGGITFD